MSYSQKNTKVIHRKIQGYSEEGYTGMEKRQMDEGQKRNIFQT